MMKSGLRAAWAGLLLPATALLVGCDQPPAKEIDAAETAVQQARASEAARYAPDRLKEAEAALDAAHRKVQEKDYRGALSSAMEAAERSRAASQAAGAAKTIVRTSAEVARAEVGAALEEVETVRGEAAEAKVPDEAFAEVEPLLADVHEGLDGVGKSLEQGNVLEAQKAAVDLKAKAAPLPGRYREALDAWQAAHPKPKPRPPRPVKKS